MDTWKRKALSFLDNDLRTNLNLPSLMRDADGLLTVDERMRIDCNGNWDEELGKLLRILREKDNKDFDRFLKVLRSNGNAQWAARITEVARQYKKEQACHGKTHIGM